MASLCIFSGQHMLRKVVSTTPLNSKAFLRLFAATPKGSPAVASSPPAKVSSSSEVADNNPVGKVYHDLVFRGSKGKPLALRDLRSLLQQCQSPDHANYGIEAVKLYQVKGQDFSEEINSHFIMAVAERGQAPLQAATMLAKYKNRIGAWSTPSSLSKLLAALQNKSNAAPVAASATKQAGGEEEEKLTGRKARTAQARAARLTKASVPTTAGELAVAVLEVASMKGVKIAPELCDLAEAILNAEPAATTPAPAVAVAPATPAAPAAPGNADVKPVLPVLDAKGRLAALRATLK